MSVLVGADGSAVLPSFERVNAAWHSRTPQPHGTDFGMWNEILAQQEHLLTMGRKGITANDPRFKHFLPRFIRSCITMPRQLRTVFLQLQAGVDAGYFADGVAGLETPALSLRGNVRTSAGVCWQMNSCYAALRRISRGRHGVSNTEMVQIVEAELVQVAFDALAKGLEGMAVTERQAMADTLLADEGNFSENRGGIGVLYGNSIISNAAFHGFHRSIRAYSKAVLDYGSAHLAQSTLSMFRMLDAYGRTPLHIAATSFGIGPDRTLPVSEVLLAAAHSITLAAGVSWISPESFLASLPCNGDACTISLHTQARHLERPMVMAPDGSARITLTAADQRDSGGWPSSGGGRHFSQLEASPPDRCDIAVVNAPFTRQVLAKYDAERRPVLIRRAATDRMMAMFARKRFLDTYGTRTAIFGTYPYSAHTVAANVTRSTMAEYVGYAERFTRSTESVASESSQDPPYYAFLNDVLLPEHTEQVHTFEAIESLGILPIPVLASLEGIAPDTVQLAIGPPRSGASVHFHKAAVNTLAYGRKRWFLFPPEAAHQSILESVNWLQQEYPTESKALFSGGERPIECVQSAGDVLFVPYGWGHGTINVDFSVAVAVELDHVVDAEQADENLNVQFWLAAWSGNTERMDALMREGASVNWVHPEHGSALDLATGQGHTTVVQFLVEHGAHASRAPRAVRVPQ
jgi:oxalate decarboxylase/phosphoglucose isomerase-like protein (cupin superfamily)